MESVCSFAKLRVLKSDFCFGMDVVLEIKYSTFLMLHPRKLTCPLKRTISIGNFIFQPSIFKGYVSFQGVFQLDLAKVTSRRSEKLEKTPTPVDISNAIGST